jgi:predicted enzyme related to lactoylglutathione lyase
MTPVHHAINYVEITVTDMDAAQHFYGTAFGWAVHRLCAGLRWHPGTWG